MAKSITTQDVKINYTEPSDYYNPEAFTELVENRRSCRFYTDEPVPEEVMQKCFDLALLAPNSSNMQPWEFYWVRSKEKRAKLNAYCLNQNTVKTAAEMVVVIARRDTWRRNAKLMLQTFENQKDIEVPKAAKYYYKKLIPMAYFQGPVGIWGFIKRIVLSVAALWRPTPRQPKSYADLRVMTQKSTALACENLMLAFRAYGYDTCPIEGLDQRRVRRLLKLPYRAEVCMAISVGKRADKGIYGPRIRFNRDLFVKEV